MLKMEMTYKFCDLCGKPLGCDYVTLEVGSEPRYYQLNISELLNRDICERCCNLFLCSDIVKKKTIEQFFTYDSYTQEEISQIFKDMQDCYNK